MDCIISMLSLVIITNNSRFVYVNSLLLVIIANNSKYVYGVSVV